MALANDSSTTLITNSFVVSMFLRVSFSPVSSPAYLETYESRLKPNGGKTAKRSQIKYSGFISRGYESDRRGNTALMIKSCISFLVRLEGINFMF